MHEWVDMKKLSELGPYGIRALEHLMSKRKENGLDKVVRKVGNKLLIRLDLFEKWIEEHK